MNNQTEREAEIKLALRQVMDPEIPTVSLVDLGLITQIKVESENTAFVSMMPTFSGCPALEYMRAMVKDKVIELGYSDVTVEIDFNQTWNTNMITEHGIKQIEAIGLSAPPTYCGKLNLDEMPKAECPNCHSFKTALISPFGPTLCRAIHYCNDCEETFEQFKPV